MRSIFPMDWSNDKQIRSSKLYEFFAHVSLIQGKHYDLL